MTCASPPARYGLIGYPVSHSVSPAMFGAAFEVLSLAATYTPVAIPPEDAPHNWLIPTNCPRL